MNQIENVTVEKIDFPSKFVLKRCIDKKGDIFWGRQMPITRSLFFCEKERKKYSLSSLQSPFQAHHINSDPVRKIWAYDRDLLEARKRAEEQGRVFIPYQQRNKVELVALDWKKTLSDFVELLDMGFRCAPLSIPESATSEEVSTNLQDANGQLSNRQQMIPTFSSNHNVMRFLPALKIVFPRQQFIGMHVMSPSNPNAKSNLEDLWRLNASIPQRQPTSLVIGFNTEKHYTKTRISGAFVAARHGIDIPSQRQMSIEQIKGMMKSRAKEGVEKEDLAYDSTEGGYNNPSEQIAWYGENRTLRLLSEISLSERLETYQALLWNNYLGLKQDFDNLNNAIIENQIQKLIESKSRWYTYVLENSPIPEVADDRKSSA